MEQFSLARLDNDRSLEEAQGLMYDAWETLDRVQRIKLAKRALELSPDCADAWVLLAEDSADTLERAAEFYQKGLEAGERALGEDEFTEFKGNFWSFLDTRPYMRARAGLAACLWDMGKHDSAVSHYYAMLELNPNDNQGNRHVLITCLMTLCRYPDAHKLLDKYKDDFSVEWSYFQALLGFIEDGDSAESRRLRGEALARNKHVPAYLGGRRKLPSEPYDYTVLHGKEEAINFTIESRAIWRSIPDAIGWLLQQAGGSKRKHKNGKRR